MYLQICIFVFVYLTVTNVIFDFLGPRLFKNITYVGNIGTLSYFVFGYLCICEFLFVNMTVHKSLDPTLF